MKKTFLLLLLVMSGAFAQKNYQTADVSLAGGGGFSAAVAYNKFIGLGAKGKFKVGYGLRLTSLFASEVDARTAPASLTSGKASLAALFSEDINAQIDTLYLGTIQTNALNLVINLQYTITPKLDIGFNIDALGFSFGANQTGKFVAQQSDAQGRSNNGRAFSTKPTAFNLLLISDSDLGSLNSELYARYWLNPKVGIRAGLSFQFSEYTASQKLAFDNDRFRTKILLPMLALSYKF